MKNILVFPCGSEIGLEVHRSLETQKDITLIGANSIDDNGKFIYQQYIGGIPDIEHPDFVESLNHIIRTHNIDLIYPCMDIVIKKLVDNAHKIDCEVIAPDKDTVDICSSKERTYYKLAGRINIPKILNKHTINEYPVFSKPAVGASSKHTATIYDSNDLDYWTRLYPDNLLLEYLPGDEFTVDCFTDRRGGLLFMGPRKRARINNGISVATEAVDDVKLFTMAETINSTLNFRGAWFFQVKKNKHGEYCLLEVACRFGGSSAIHRLMGINFAYLTILDRLLFDVDVLFQKLDLKISRSLSINTELNIQYDTVYIDFDDTIIIRGAVNLDAIKLLYKLINQSKKIILITKHAGNLDSAFKKYKISKNIFDDIIQISKNDKKYKYITGNSIFIDDSFSERVDVTTRLGIPVFAVDAINCLP